MSRPAAVELLAAFAAVMRRHRRRWFVFGAQAVVVYGRPRMTADVDVTVEVDGPALPGLLRDLTSAGFRARVPFTADFIAQARVLPLVHDATTMPLDLVIAGPGLEDEFLARARPTDIGGVKVPLISAEDLLATKVLAGRPKDLDDVRGILAERSARLDLARTRDILGAIEEALGQRDLLPVLEALVSESAAARPDAPRGRRPRKKQPPSRKKPR